MKKQILIWMAAGMLLGGCSSRQQIRLNNAAAGGKQTSETAGEKGKMTEAEEEEATDQDTSEMVIENGELEEMAPEGTRPVPEENDKSYVLLEMESINQNPELPTGCESVALTIVLNYFDFSLEKTTIADKYLLFDENNFAAGYMGDPHTEEGAGVFPPGLVDTADHFLVENGSPKRAFDLTGTDFSDLYDYVAEGIPVIVWNSMYMMEPIPTSEVCEYEGRMYQWFNNEHCVVFCGFDKEENVVFVQDPLEGLVERDAEEFERYYDTLGKNAMIIH